MREKRFLGVGFGAIVSFRFFQRGSSSPQFQEWRPRRITFVDRPSPYIYALCAKQAYHDQAGSLPQKSDWVIHDKSDKTAENGYYGVAYRNDETKHIIIAHRGTNPSNKQEFFKDVVSDVEGIVRVGITSQQISALSFATQVRDNVQKEGYRVSLTGHSLGGWLAQVTLYHFKRQGYHTSAVVFDSPGVSDILNELQPDDGSTKVILEKLDITIYNSAPNFVNSCNSHGVGTIYRLYPDLPPTEGLWDYFYGNLLTQAKQTLNSHSMSGILNCFDPISGEPKKVSRMLKWPRIIWRKKNEINEKNQVQNKPNWLGAVIHWITGIELPSILTRTVGSYIFKSMPAAAGLSEITQLLIDIAKGNMNDHSYRLFHQYVTIGKRHQGNYEPDFEGLNQEQQYRLQHEARYEIDHDFDEKTCLPLRHLPDNVVQFLTCYEKYSKRYASKLDFKEFFEDFLKINDDKHDKDKMQQLLHYDIHKERSLLRIVITPNSTVSHVTQFRNQVICFLNDFPMATDNLKTFPQQISLRNLERKDYDEVKSNLEAQWEINFELLSKLNALYPFARLYLFGSPSNEEINQHKRDAEAIERQLFLNSQMEGKLSTLESGAGGLPSTAKIDGLRQMILTQKSQLKLAALMNEALLLHKQHKPDQANQKLIEAENLLESEQENILRHMEHTKTFNLANLKASLFILQGKLFRVIEPKENWRETVLVSYNNALAQNRDPNVLSSTGALLNDLGLHQEAKTCHEEAIRRQGTEADATVLGNYARGLYMEALILSQNSQTDQKSQKEELLEQSLRYFDQSIKKKEVAGSLRDRGRVYEAKGQKDHALSDFNEGLSIDPNNLKLRFERARFYVEQGNFSKAKEDLALLLDGLNIYVGKSSDFKALAKKANDLNERIMESEREMKKLKK